MECREVSILFLLAMKCQVIDSMNTEMTSKVFDKLYSLLLLLLPKLHVSILAGRDYEVCPEKNEFTLRRNKAMPTCLNKLRCRHQFHVN